MTAQRPLRVVLVGFMAAGKTSVGRELATLLDWDFVDLDDVVEAREGATIAEIFAQRGEPAFREAERVAAAGLARRERVVIAAGGGAFHEQNTRAQLSQSRTLTVWLRCDLDTLMERIGRDGARPLAGSRERMRALLDQREKSYRLAERLEDTAATSPAEVARRLCRVIVEDAEPEGRGGRCVT